MNEHGQQAELFGLVPQTTEYPFRLRVNDIVRIDGKLCRIIRVTECAAVVLMNRPPREFKTRFDRQVRFQPRPAMFRISPNAEVEVLTNRKPNGKEANERIHRHSGRKPRQRLR
jgi:hypothetical protein